MKKWQVAAVCFFILHSSFFIRTSKFELPLNCPRMSSVPQPTPATCPRCSGSGWIPLSGDSLRVEPCACQGDLRRRQRISASNIPRRYLTCRLRNFNESGPVLKTAKTRVEQFVNEWMPQLGAKGLL